MHIIQEEIGLPKITVEHKDDHYAIVTISPLPSGYGMTLGNALRRVMLSSLPGAAVSGIKIKGVSHEYTTIKGVKESVLDIILNLKQLNVQKETTEISILTLSANAAGEVTAKSIKAPGDVKVLNKELYITTIEKGTKLDIEIFVEKGVGYKPATLEKKDGQDAEMIEVDAVFGPVKKIKYDVEATRVGKMTNLDKLVMEIETNGSLEPEDAVKFAANVLTSYFEIFDKADVPVEAEFMSDFEKIAQKTAEEDSLKPSQEMYTPIEILGLSPRTLNSLINGGIGSIEQLTKCTESKLNNLRGFGKKALTEVSDALKTRDLALSGEE
ncbi:MAG: DNA-directed RNA polymerase subunit alpha [Patescibacteria group bacterium]|nr:DNA-directed RNA polymerase subunit alpha [Patescibacteria group bacterium]